MVGEDKLAKGRSRSQCGQARRRDLRRARAGEEHERIQAAHPEKTSAMHSRIEHAEAGQRPTPKGEIDICRPLTFRPTHSACTYLDSKL